uniref:Uncharacterized protein n=1 Tax=Yersinia enterocolitica TaxID=630 RepID=B0RKW0_YEREN|nr:hypothetical protein [Yersinia enterocolitica]
MCRSCARAPDSLTCVNSRVNPVLASISSNSSVKSTGGSSSLTRLLRRCNDGGSSSFSRLLIVREGCLPSWQI